MTKTVLIIGGGAAGMAAAHQLTLMGGWDITLVEQAPFLGAGVRTNFHGGHPFTFGPRHFLTQNEKVYEYLNGVLPLRRCQEHQFLTYVKQDEAFYNYPIHIDDISRMPDEGKINDELDERHHNQALQKATHEYLQPPANLEEYWARSVGRTLYEKFIEKYSAKMWGLPATSLDTFDWSPKGVTLKSGPRAAWDTAISAYPYAHDGYNSWFGIATEGVKVHLSTKIDMYDFVRKEVWFGDHKRQFDVIVSTISPDVPFDYMHGHLPYIGRDFHKIVLPVEFALPPDVYFIYSAGDDAWTRITEFKRFTQHKSDQTLLGMEIPSRNGKYYPLPIKRIQAVAERYYQQMAPGVFCLGRNGSYRYGLDIAGCIEQSFALIDILKQGGQDHPVPMKKWRL